MCKGQTITTLLESYAAFTRCVQRQIVASAEAVHDPRDRMYGLRLRVSVAWKAVDLKQAVSAA